MDDQHGNRDLARGNNQCLAADARYYRRAHGDERQRQDRRAQHPATIGERHVSVGLTSSLSSPPVHSSLVRTVAVGSVAPFSLPGITRCTVQFIEGSDYRVPILLPPTTGFDRGRLPRHRFVVEWAVQDCHRQSNTGRHPLRRPVPAATTAPRPIRAPLSMSAPWPIQAPSSTTMSPFDDGYPSRPDPGSFQRILNGYEDSPIEGMFATEYECHRRRDTAVAPDDQPCLSQSPSKYTTWGAPYDPSPNSMRPRRRSRPKGDMRIRTDANTRRGVKRTNGIAPSQSVLMSRPRSPRAFQALCAPTPVRTGRSRKLKSPLRRDSRR